jgi:hypothetical protein
MTLHLTLKKRWFDMTRSGEKKEEYREIKPYWISRICEDHDGCIRGEFIDRDKIISYTFKKFTFAQLRNGYSSDAPTILRSIESIRIGTGNEEWGAEPNKFYFVIKYKD